MTPIRSGDDEARSGDPYSERKPADLERARRYRAEREGRYRARKEPIDICPHPFLRGCLGVLVVLGGLPVGGVFALLLMWNDLRTANLGTAIGVFFLGALIGGVVAVVVWTQLGGFWLVMVWGGLLFGALFGGLLVEFLLDGRGEGPNMGIILGAIIGGVVAPILWAVWEARR